MYLFVQTVTGPFVGQSNLAVRLSKDSSSPKLTPKDESLTRKHCLFKEKDLHTNKKCISVLGPQGEPLYVMVPGHILVSP